MRRELMNPVDHLQINVSDLRRSMKFYDDMLSCLDFTRVLKAKNIVQWQKGRTRIILVRCPRRFLANRFHRKHIGLNHIAFRAPTRAAVDKFYQNFLVAKKVPMLYGGLREWPEYEKGYYAVYFEDPDRMKLELVYTPNRGT